MKRLPRGAPMMLTMALALTATSCIFVSSREVQYVDSKGSARDFRDACVWEDAIYVDGSVDQARASGARAAFQAAAAAATAAEAEDHLERSLEFAPSAAAANNLGCVHVARGQKKAARASFRWALALDPACASARQNLDEL